MLRRALRLKLLLGVLALTILGFAQTANPPTTNPPQGPAAASKDLDAATKTDILKGLEEIVTKRAFVPGVDFSKWPAFVEKKKDDIDKATTEADFTRVMNTVLRDFGVSHI